MQRRALLATTVAALSAHAQKPAASLIKPRVLRAGDAVGLITPSTYVSDPDALQTAARTMEFFGLKPKWGANVKRKNGYLGGSIEERVSDLHAMFADPSIKGIVCIRGGYGSAQLLPAIDFELIRKNPKIFIGYSDITALHLAIQKKAGLVTFHGPVALSGFSKFTQKYYRKALFEAAPIGLITNPEESNPLRPQHTLRTVRAGSARGPLIGGNLTLISTTMGTPYEIETAGRILFIEDVGEEPYSMDRMMTQLRIAGKLDAAAGIVFGECAGCRPRKFEPGFENTLTLGEAVDEILGKLKIPVLAGLTFGHTDDQVTLPEGVMATLDASKGQLTIEEAATIA